MLEKAFSGEVERDVLETPARPPPESITPERAAEDVSAAGRLSRAQFDAGEQERPPGYIFKSDIVYEQLAHKFAYQDALSDEDRAWLAKQGYRASAVKHGQFGFAMIAFLPLPGFDRAPVLTFRGTNDMKDVRDDLAPNGVGAYQFAANEGMIARTLAGLGKADVAGHSLGGALAQMAGVRYPGSVGNIVTFQAPGIDADMVAKLTAADAPHGDAPGRGAHRSRHYVVKGDIVSHAGEGRTPGSVTEIERPSGYLYRHTGFPVTAAYHDRYPSVRDGVDRDRIGTPSHWTQGEPSARMTVVESLRRVFGTLLRAVDHDAARRDKYVNVWNRVHEAIDTGAPLDAVESIIAKAELSDADREMMLANLADVRASEQP